MLPNDEIVSSVSLFAGRMFSNWGVVIYFIHDGLEPAAEVWREIANAERSSTVLFDPRKLPNDRPSIDRFTVLVAGPLPPPPLIRTGAGTRPPIAKPGRVMLFNEWKKSEPYFCTAAARVTNSPRDRRARMLSLVVEPGPSIMPPAA